MTCTLILQTRCPQSLASHQTKDRYPVGTTVTITGTSFTDATTVLFNGVANTTPFTVNSDTSITATSPPVQRVRWSGPVTVQVTTPFGTSTNSLNDLYTYTADPAPIVTGLAPAMDRYPAEQQLPSPVPASPMQPRYCLTVSQTQPHSP